MNIPCHLDICEAINIFLGGLVVSVIFTGLSDFLRNYKFKKRYASIAGTYEGFNPSKVKISDAVVTYIGENKLEMTLTHPTNDNRKIRKWHGFITMFNDTYGELQFMYIEPLEDAHENGVRKVIITNDSNSTFILIGKRPDYHDEYFRRKTLVKPMTKSGT